MLGELDLLVHAEVAVVAEDVVAVPAEHFRDAAHAAVAISRLHFADHVPLEPERLGLGAGTHVHVVAA